MKLTQALLIFLISFICLTFVQCDGEEEPQSPPRHTRGKHPILRKVFLTSPQWMHIPFSAIGGIVSYILYHFFG
ncbi:unnamed protein product [Trichobilharzia szidati]|nr:unnamed protein product [Trichobilharzia szidati]